MGDLTVVASYNTEIEAQLVVQRLEAAGIPAMIRSDNLGGTFPMMQMATGGFEILVADNEATAARLQIVNLGRNALDPQPSGRQRPVDEPERSIRTAYVIAALIGMLIFGLGGARVLFGGGFGF